LERNGPFYEFGQEKGSRAVPGVSLDVRSSIDPNNRFFVVDLLLYVALIAAKLGTDGAEQKWSEYKMWKTRWRELQQGFLPHQVQALLGKPKRVQVQGASTMWRYAFGSFLVFTGERLVAWTEPR